MRKQLTSRLRAVVLPADGRETSKIIRSLAALAAVGVALAGLITWITRAEPVLWQLDTVLPGSVPPDCMADLDTCEATIMLNTDGRPAYRESDYTNDTATTITRSCAFERGTIVHLDVQRAYDGDLNENLVTGGRFFDVTQSVEDFNTTDLLEAPIDCAIVQTTPQATEFERGLDAPFRIEQNNVFTIEGGQDQVSSWSYLVAPDEDITEVTVPVAEALELGAIDNLPVVQRRVGLAEIWGITGGLLALVAAVAVPLVRVGRRAEDQASRLRQMSFGLAHDLRTPIRGMAAAGDRLGRNAEGRTKELADQITDGAAELRATLDRFAEITGGADTDPESDSQQT